MTFPIRSLFTFAILLTGILFDSCTKKENPPSTYGLHISSFAPAEGAKDATIIIAGTNFSPSAPANAVTFNGIPAVVTASTQTQLTVKVPQASGTGKIGVRIGSQSTSSADDFTYIYTVSNFAGNGTYGFKDGAANADAQFKSAYGIITDAAGNVYVADSDNNRIRKILPSGEVITLAGDGTIGAHNGAGQIARFNYPHGLAIDANGNLFVADAGNNLIRKVTPAGVVSTVAGNGTPGLVEGAAGQAEFNFPGSIAIDATGNLFVSDGSNHRIRKITAAGTVSTLGEAVFNFPEGIAIDAAGNLYVADTGGSVIRKVTPAGAISVLAGSGVGGFKDGAGTAAQFFDPEGLTIDAAGNLYIGDLANNAVRKITPAGVVSTIAGNGRGYANGAGPDAQFYGPSGMAVDVAGNIYVTDTINSRIRKLE